MSKTKSIRKHFRKRLNERFGLEMTQHIRDQLLSQIRNRTGQFLEKQSNRVSVWLCEVEGRRMKVVYDKMRGEIVTVMD